MDREFPLVETREYEVHTPSSWVAIDNHHADTKGVGSYLCIFVDVYRPNWQLTSHGTRPGMNTVSTPIILWHSLFSTVPTTGTCFEGTQVLCD
jgi:hypothetical protein